MKKIISFILTSIVALYLSMSVAFSAANEVRAAFFLEWATPNQESKVKKIYDKALGVPVKWTDFATGVEMTEAMLSGDIDISYSQGMTPFVNAVNAKAPIKIVDVAVEYGMGGTGCVVSNASGITKANAKELEGKKVAVPLNTMADYAMRMIAKHLDFDVGALELVDMEPADGAVALVDGNVTMACMFGKNSIDKGLEAGSMLMTTAEATAAGITSFDITSVTDKFLAENPEMVRTFLEVTAEANADWAAGKSNINVIAKDAGMSVEKTKNQMAGFKFPTPAEQRKSWLNSGGKVEGMLEFMGKMFGTAENPALSDYSKTINNSFLPG
ncbi:MAG: taurine ABC transporter substrate-binding protein [Candidatus Pelagibacter sp.]|nr:taurine ABC transporter substrate-binding protein [Candidatus Pelagibacter sp.]